MNFSYESSGLKVGITGATADDIVKIMHEILGDQSQIDQIVAKVNSLAGRLRVSATALQGEISKET